MKAGPHKFRPGKACNTAFTLFDLLFLMILFCVLIFGALLLMPASTGNKVRASRINCINNLKQIGLSFGSWVVDHKDRFPMEVSKTNGGTMEFVSEGLAFKHFAVMSNELTTPNVLLCPTDKRRSAAADFGANLNNSKISYFVGVDATRAKPQMLLSGDWNITNGIKIRGGFLELTTNQPVEWTEQLHIKCGNAGLADGSVQQLTTMRLRDQIAFSGMVTNRLAMP